MISSNPARMPKASVLNVFIHLQDSLTQNLRLVRASETSTGGSKTHRKHHWTVAVGWLISFLLFASSCPLGVNASILQQMPLTLSTKGLLSHLQLRLRLAISRTITSSVVRRFSKTLKDKHLPAVTWKGVWFCWFSLYPASICLSTLHKSLKLASIICFKWFSITKVSSLHVRGALTFAFESIAVYLVHL